MKSIVLEVPTFAFIVGTRAALAGGIALLLGNRLSPYQRRAIGAALFVVGAATTVSAGISAARGLRRSKRRGLEPGIVYDEKLIGVRRFPRKGDDEDDEIG